MSTNSPAQSLTDLLVTRNFDVTALDVKTGRPPVDDQGRPDPSKANDFTFNYIGKSGQNYGAVNIFLGADDEFIIGSGNNTGKAMENPEDKDDWFDFLGQLKEFAMRNGFNKFTIENLNRLKYLKQSMAAITESFHGNRKYSFSGQPTEARLMIKHSRPINEGDARFRYIESLFIETADGERYKLPFRKLAGGRAMLEHVRQGGRPWDERGNHIVHMVEQINVLGQFSRAHQGRLFEGEAADLINETTNYFKNLRSNLKSMSTKSGYQKYFESWKPDQITEEELIVEDLKGLFVETRIDPRIEQALPLLAAIQKRNTMKEADEFESWAKQITEGTWALPSTQEEINKLQDLMSQPLMVGPDAANTSVLKDIIGDDTLYDILDDLAEQDPQANIWDDTDVQNRLRELGVEMPMPAEQDDASADTDADANAEDDTEDDTVREDHKTEQKFVLIIDGNEKFKFSTREAAESMANLYQRAHPDSRVEVMDKVMYKTVYEQQTELKKVVNESSDVSGLLAAANLNKSFIITAKTAEGETKKFRVRAMSERVAREKFKIHHSKAKILSVEEEVSENQGVAEGSDKDSDNKAQQVADRLCTDRNLEKLMSMAHDSTIYRALDRYFEKNGIPEAIYNRVAAIVFKKLQDHGRRLSTEPTIQEQGVAEGTGGPSWQEVVNALSQGYPDVDPTDSLAPIMRKYQVSFDQLDQLARKNGYDNVYAVLDDFVNEQGVAEDTNTQLQRYNHESEFVNQIPREYQDPIDSADGSRGTFYDKNNQEIGFFVRDDFRVHDSPGKGAYWGPKSNITEKGHPGVEEGDNLQHFEEDNTPGAVGFFKEGGTVQGCNMTEEGVMCPVHGMAECWEQETSNPIGWKQPMGAAFESTDSDELARIKSLALLK